VVAFGAQRVLCVELYPLFLNCRLHHPPADLLQAAVSASPSSSVSSTDPASSPAASPTSAPTVPLGDDSDDGDEQLPLMVSSQSSLAKLLHLAAEFHVGHAAGVDLAALCVCVSVSFALTVYR
jgi:hypothetical protein